MQDKSARQLGGGGGGLTEDEGEDEAQPPLKKPAAELVQIGGLERRVVHGVAEFAQRSREDPARIPQGSRKEQEQELENEPEQQQEEQQQQDWEQENEQEQEPEQMQQVQQQQQQQWSMDSIMEAAMYKLVYGE